jgi:hypothetical protein
MQRLHTGGVERPLPGSRAGTVRVVGAIGTVAAAAGAHVAAGGALPSPLLLVLLTCALAGVATRVPPRLGTVRLQLGAAAVLQPMLHALFDHLAAAGPSGAFGAMTLAHTGAALVGVWWFHQGAGRLAAAVVALLRRRAPVRLAGAPTSASRRRLADATAAPARRDPVARMRRRGPPRRLRPVAV